MLHVKSNRKTEIFCFYQENSSASGAFSAPTHLGRELDVEDNVNKNYSIPLDIYD